MAVPPIIDAGELEAVQTQIGQAREQLARRIQQDMIYWKPAIEQLGIRPD